MKVFNVLVNEVYSFETTNSIYSFLNKEDAEAKVKQLRDNYMQQVKPDPECYHIDEDKDTFDCYPEGNAGEEHYTVQIYECEVEGSDSTDRQLAMRQMEQELLEIIKEHGECGMLNLEDLDMKWSSESDGEIYTEDITGIEIETTWDGEEFVLVHMDDGDEPFSDCDHEDLCHNLADYIYNEIKANYYICKV